MYFSIRLDRMTNLRLIFNFLSARLFGTAHLFEFKGILGRPLIKGGPLIKFEANFLAARLFRTPGYSELQSSLADILCDPLSILFTKSLKEGIVPWKLV